MSKAELIREIIELDQQVHRALSQRTVDAWINLDLTMPQLRTLSFIDNQGTTNVKNIAEGLGVTSSNMTGIIDRLVKQKLVIRRENPVDRRMQELSLTEKGKNTLTGLQKKVMNSMSEALGNMTEDDLATLKRGLSIWIKAAEAVRGDK